MGRGDRDLGKEQFWRGLLRQWDGRKQTVREFCAEHGVSQPSFYAWRRTIAQRDRQSARPKAGEDQAVFVPVKMMAPTPNPVLEVVAPSGHLVRVPPEFDAATLRRLFAVLEEATSC